MGEAWSGLGYYSRARRLHEAAVYITDTCDGVMPRDTRALLTLPGVGRYTASAVASIAHNQVTGLVDGNVSRVLSRVTRVGADIAAGHVVQHMWDTADQLVDQDRPGEFNQAMMELGAVICTPKTPNCSSCPVQTQCSAYNNNNQIQTPDIEDCDLCLGSKNYNPDLGVMNYPRKVKKTTSRDQETLVVVVSRSSDAGSKYLLERRPSKGLLANLLQFPSVELTPGQEVKESEKIRLLTQLLCQKNVKHGSLCKVDSINHIFSHINMTYTVYKTNLDGDDKDDLEENSENTWLTETEFNSCGTSTAMKKVFKCCQSEGSVKKTKKVTKTDKQQPSLLTFFKVKN